MADADDIDTQVEEEYDEEADSDFDDSKGADDGRMSSSEEEEAEEEDSGLHPQKRRRLNKSASIPEVVELDSGDEATIQEQKKAQRKQRRKGETIDDDSGHESEGWRARTRAMRGRDKEELKTNKLASIHNSTIDVDKMWEEMNRPGPLSPPSLEGTQQETRDSRTQKYPNLDKEWRQDIANKENIPAPSDEEMITIKRTYKFAGEVHTEEKRVPKSSAEARLWLAQHTSRPENTDPEAGFVNRPTRKISRFDPNYANLDAFRTNWSAAAGGQKILTGPKLNVVEKSKMDWAVHVDAAGLKEELDVHAKAKEGYLTRMDFLGQVEQRREEEARTARLRGQ